MQKVIALALLAMLCVNATAAGYNYEQRMKERGHGHNNIRSDASRASYLRTEQSIRERHYSKGLTAETQPKDGLFGWALGFSFGLQYSPMSQGSCYLALENSVMLGYEMWQQILMLVVNPLMWGEMMVYGIEFSDIYAEIFDNCKITVLMNTLSGLAANNFEGLTEMTGRLGAAFIIDIPKKMELIKNGKNDYIKGKALGGLFALIFDYHI